MLKTLYRLLCEGVNKPRPAKYLSPKERGIVSGGTWEGKPSIAAQTVGLELLWPSFFTLTVTNIGGKLEYETEVWHKSQSYLKAFKPDVRIKQIDADHYSIDTALDIVFPTGMNALLLPSPRFYEPVPLCAYNDAPAVVPCLLELDRMTEPVTVVFRMPQEKTQQIFNPDEAFCQIVPTPRGDVVAWEMLESEAEKRAVAIHSAEVAE